MARLSRLLEWLRGDRDVTRALVVDDEGLPLVGSTSGDLGDAESLLAATGSVASAMKRQALATPGSLSGDFEGHVGDGPVLQLIGIPVGGRAFIVGISRRQPFGKADVESIRAAFERALAGSALTNSSPGGA
jgi:predicted regulator of Ras-like GTPase activity (Roadblock/LC7/MglB family)